MYLLILFGVDLLVRVFDITITIDFDYKTFEKFKNIVLFGNGNIHRYYPICSTVYFPVVVLLRSLMYKVIDIFFIFICFPGQLTGPIYKYTVI